MSAVTHTTGQQKERPVLVENGLCSRFRCSHVKCTACSVVCPVPGAVRYAEQCVEINDKCIRCGVCASACPNGAIRPNGGDSRLSARIRERTCPGRSFTFACEQAAAQADLTVGCLGRLTEALVIEPLRHGAATAELCAADCSRCELGASALQWETVLASSQSLLRAIGADPERVRLKRAAMSPRAPAQPKRSRRALLTALVTSLWVEDEPNPEPAGANSAPPLSHRDLVQRQHENPKRSHLLQILHELPPGGAKGERPVAAPAAAPFAQVSVSSSCTGCNVCEQLCPVGALRHSEKGGDYVLDFHPELCTGCRVCEASCYHKAITLAPADLALVVDPQVIRLFQAPRRQCRGCGGHFLGQPADYCPPCQLGAERRTAAARRFIIGGIAP